MDGELYITDMDIFLTIDSDWYLTVAPTCSLNTDASENNFGTMCIFFDEIVPNVFHSC